MFSSKKNKIKGNKAVDANSLISTDSIGQLAYPAAEKQQLPVKDGMGSSHNYESAEGLASEGEKAKKHWYSLRRKKRDKDQYESSESLVSEGEKAKKHWYSLGREKRDKDQYESSESLVSEGEKAQEKLKRLLSRSSIKKQGGSMDPLPTPITPIPPSNTVDVTSEKKEITRIPPRNTVDVTSEEKESLKKWSNFEIDKGSERKFAGSAEQIGSVNKLIKSPQPPVMVAKVDDTSTRLKDINQDPLTLHSGAALPVDQDVTRGPIKAVGQLSKSPQPPVMVTKVDDTSTRLKDIKQDPLTLHSGAALPVDQDVTRGPIKAVGQLSKSPQPPVMVTKLECVKKEDLAHGKNLEFINDKLDTENPGTPCIVESHNKKRRCLSVSLFSIAVLLAVTCVAVVGVICVLEGKRTKIAALQDCAEFLVEKFGVKVARQLSCSLGIIVTFSLAICVIVGILSAVDSLVYQRSRSNEKLSSAGNMSVNGDNKEFIKIDDEVDQFAVVDAKDKMTSDGCSADNSLDSIMPNMLSSVVSVGGPRDIVTPYDSH